MIKIILALLISLNANALSIKVNTIEIDPLISGKFKAFSSENLDAGYALIDCQSFFQKADFYNAKSSLLSENYISVHECTEIYANIKSCLKQSKIKCLDSNYLFDTGCECK